jgi:hypothetical protein
MDPPEFWLGPVHIKFSGGAVRLVLPEADWARMPALKKRPKQKREVWIIYRYIRIESMLIFTRGINYSLGRSYTKLR